LLIASFCCNYIIAQPIRHSYRFFNTLSTADGNCGQDLVPTKGLNMQCNPTTAATSGRFITDRLTSGVSRVVYHNNLNWGLKYLNTNGVIQNSYTVQMYLKVTNFNRFYTRIIDFSNGTQDNGIYFTNYNLSPPTNNRCLNFYPNGNFGICPFFNDTTYYLLTFTRDNVTRRIDIYVNDQLFTSYNDLNNFYTGAINRPVHIFRDDPIGFACEDGEANFAYLSFTNFYSSQGDVTLAFNNIDTVATTADFQFSNDTACSNSDVTVTYNGNIPPNSTEYAFTWNWDGGTVVSGSGGGPYTIQWPTSGNKNITLNITGGACIANYTSSKQINISNSITLQKDTTICNGQSYLGHSGSGAYTEMLPSATGCDTVLSINLTVLPAASSSVDTTICNGATFEGFATTSTHIRNLTTASGCDSIRTIRLTVLPAAISSVDTSICPGASFEGFSVAGTHIRNLTTAFGCDSVRTIRLGILPAPASSIDTTICNGASFEGFSTTGTHVKNFTTPSGCDSTRTIRLTILPPANSFIDTSICQGASFEGHTTSGTYIQNLISFKGCDSTKTIKLTVLPVAASSVDTSICNGASFEGFMATGTYTRNLTTASGCDSTRTIRLTVLPAAVSSVDTTICSRATFEGFATTGTHIRNLTTVSGCDSTRTIRLTVIPVAGSYVDTTICIGSSFEGFNTPGTHVLAFTSASGCDSTRTIQLWVVPALLPNLGNKTMLCAGDSIVLSPGNFDSYQWQDGSTQKSYTVKKEGLYSVRVQNNCIDTTATIFIQESSCSVLFPSAFTPGNGGPNETFRVSQGNIFAEYHLMVFNRYGEIVFESFSPSVGWDGKHKGKDAGNGTYVWVCSYKTTNAKPLKKQKGTVLLLR